MQGGIKMINTFIIEGKLKEISEIKETEKGIKYCHIVMTVERNYRNSEGHFDVDLIEVELWRGIAEICTENSKVDDTISIQGRIQSRLMMNCSCCLQGSLQGI